MISTLDVNQRSNSLYIKFYHGQLANVALQQNE